MKDSTIVWIYVCSMLMTWVMIDKVVDIYFDNYEMRTKFQDDLWFAGCIP